MFGVHFSKTEPGATQSFNSKSAVKVAFYELYAFWHKSKHKTRFHGNMHVFFHVTYWLCGARKWRYCNLQMKSIPHELPFKEKGLGWAALFHFGAELSLDKDRLRSFFFIWYNYFMPIKTFFKWKTTRLSADVFMFLSELPLSDKSYWVSIILFII